jgi:hypothetical protein
VATTPAPATAEGRWGSGVVKIVEVALFDAAGHPAHVFQSGDPVRLGMRLQAAHPVTDFAFGIGIFNAEGACVYGTNTEIEEFEPITLEGDANVDVSFDSVELTEGTYRLDVAVHTREGVPYDYHRFLHTFRIKSRTKDVGVYRPKHHWAFSANVRIRPRA